MAWRWLDQDGYSTIQSVKPYHDAEPLYATLPAQPAPAVPVSWERLRTLMDGIPTREEFIGGQRQQYVAKEAVMGWLYEGQLRAEREAALSAAPAVREPLSGDVLYALWASENGLEDCKLCRLNDFTKAARFFEQAHGIAAPGSKP